MSFSTPVLLIIFNRPDKVKKLIEALAEIQPQYLYISADGPRSHVATDTANCNEARYLAQTISWPCEIHTNFSAKNLGVDKGMETAMNWFFSSVEEGIVIEDDCIPHRDFFRFTENLLEKYRDNPRIMLICGSNFQDGIARGTESYYFSEYPTWGYAMWRRTWTQFDSTLSHLEEFEKEHRIDEILEDPRQKKFWLNFFRKIRRGKFNFTDTRLAFSMWNAYGMCIIPNVNLIKNVGFGSDATHTTASDKDKSIETQPLGTIVHPPAIAINRTADDYFFYKTHNNSFLKKALIKIKILGAGYRRKLS